MSKRKTLLSFWSTKKACTSTKVSNDEYFDNDKSDYEELEDLSENDQESNSESENERESETSEQQSSR